MLLKRLLPKIDPDGVPIEINLIDIEPGESFLIPCLNVSKARDQVERIAKKVRRQIATEPVMAGEMYGLRVWRTG